MDACKKIISFKMHLIIKDKWLHAGCNENEHSGHKGIKEEERKKNPVHSVPVREERDRMWKHVRRWHCDCRREPRRSQVRSLSQENKVKNRNFSLNLSPRRQIPTRPSEQLLNCIFIFLLKFPGSFFFFFFFFFHFFFKTLDSHRKWNLRKTQNAPTNLNKLNSK